jgi:type VI protein secretion system component VasF
MYKEVFVSLGGKKSGVYAVEVSRAEAMTYESNKQKKAPLLARAKELGSMVEALRSMTEEQDEEQKVEEALSKLRPTRRISLLKKLLLKTEGNN